MAQPYVPPGVTITEALNPQVVPLLASPADVCLVGLALGHETTTDQLVLVKEKEPIKLPTLAALPNSKLLKIISVYSALDPSEGENNGEGFASGSAGWKEGKEAGTIEITGSSSKILPKTLVNVTYTYVPADYYNPVRLFSFAEVQNRFGNALVNNAIGSPLSLAAQKAFENGAGNLILQPLFATKEGKPVEYNSGGFITNAEQPTEKQNSEATVWRTCLETLELVENLDIIVPIVGQSQTDVTDAAEVSIFNSILGLEQLENSNEKYIIGIFGEDASVPTSLAEAKAKTIREHAGELQSYAGGSLSSQNVLLNIANLSIPLPNKQGNLALGAQYLAAAIAGAIAARPVASSMTRKQIVGFNSLNDLRSPAEKNVDAGSGLMVVEQIQGGAIRVRHAITLDNTQGAARSELSVVRAKFLMIESVKKTLENQIIGQIIADANSPIIVRSAIVGVLSALQSAGDIVDYATPVCAISSLEPTTITASFSYRPSFTVNYIDISFALDLTAQTVTVTEISNTTSES